MGIFYLTYKIYFGIVFFTVLSLFYIPLRIASLYSYKSVYFVQRLAAKLLEFLTLNIILTKKKPKQLEGPYIVCSNHSSYIDITLLISLLKFPTVFMGKGELQNWPLFKFLFKNKHIPVFRSSPIKAARSLEMAKERLQNGISVVIFPEGTISADVPNMRAFKNGPFKLAIETGFPILPITFPDNYKHMMDLEFIWGKGRPGINRAYIHEPIETANLTLNNLHQLKETVRESIEQNLYD